MLGLIGHAITSLMPNYMTAMTAADISEYLTFMGALLVAGFALAITLISIIPTFIGYIAGARTSYMEATESAGHVGRGLKLLRLAAGIYLFGLLVCIAGKLSPDIAFVIISAVDFIVGALVTMVSVQKFAGILDAKQP